MLTSKTITRRLAARNKEISLSACPSSACLLVPRLLVTCLLVPCLLSSCVAGSRQLPVNGCYRVVPADYDDREDVRWAEYISGQIKRRAITATIAPGNDIVANQEAVKIVVDVNGGMATDYKVELHGTELRLSARDKQKMLWLAYQFISQCDGIDASDLPPAYIPMDGCEGDFAFEYRGIYTPSNSDTELMPIMATGNVDYDWALWGHNLRKVFGGDVPENAFATVDGKRAGNQLCFSSEELYKAVEAFVADYGGDNPKDETARFAIMPDDNKTVCQCSECVAKGNTALSATPAVTAMLHRLAERFPKCKFFTSSYHTTAEPPTEPLPQNVGVLVSAIGLPMRGQVAARPQAEKLKNLVADWRKVVSTVYVWDYMRNYDDYFTPYPCLGLMAERLRFFRSIGVDGVFLNGSSPYYASFDDVQTAAIAALMVNPDIAVAEYAGKCFSRYYPVTASVLSPAYLSWESEVMRRDATLPFYGDIAAAKRAWLDETAYNAYCDSLDRKAKRAKTAERQRLNRLLTATWFTRLELLRQREVPPSSDNYRQCLDGLKGYTAFKDMSHYKETGGDMEKYVEKVKSEERRVKNEEYQSPQVVSVLSVPFVLSSYQKK